MDSSETMATEKIIESKSSVPYSYSTIKITQSRILKGLLAIPVSLLDKFPTNRTQILVYLNESSNAVEKSFTPYKSTSRECRIGGMKHFFSRNDVNPGEEIVIQFLGQRKYRIITEKKFLASISKLENKFDDSQDDNSFKQSINKLTKITNSNEKDVLQSEYLRLTKLELARRKYTENVKSKRKERAPHSIRNLLLKLYEGKCQLTRFCFLMKNGLPYFETHHINPKFGDHLKNILVVSPNIHAQFTYAQVAHFFDNNGWLRRVRLNEAEYNVFQIIDKIPVSTSKSIHY